jgi:hypothetical protein
LGKVRASVREAGASGALERHSQRRAGAPKPIDDTPIDGTMCVADSDSDLPAGSQQHTVQALFKQQSRADLIVEPRASAANVHDPARIAKATSGSRRY